MNRLKKYIIIFIAGMMIFGLSACQSNDKVSSNAPKMVKYSFEPSNRGSENTQYVKARILYDSPISVSKSAAQDLRITIGGERVKASNITTSLDNKNNKLLIIDMHVSGITDGKILIAPIEKSDRVKGINEESKKSPASFKEINALVPSGVELKTLNAVTGDANNPAKVTKELTNIWKVRGIAWVMFKENGNPLLPEANNSKTAVATDNKLELKVFNNAVSVHGHGLKDMNKYSAVNDIADILKQCFGNKYNITVNDTTFTVEAKTPAVGQTLDVEILNTLTEK